uniref:Uncharacterized protein TCIL3000_10_4460 n=1 Tax=Trypanosoma congolense (strain IL3000) TaxID=1068625 RepID=G0UWB7_TRYCI|nr:unnamed protein product [Trypanosoma congolense IL3000]
MSQRFGPYRVGETIGRGTFAKVKIALHELTNTQVALKIIPRRVMDDAKSKTKLTREIRILQTLQHPNIMKLFQVVQTRQDIVLVLEYVSGGELFDYICQRGPLSEGTVRHIFQQIVAAVAYCHRYRVIHRDLKPENILLEKGTNTVKLADFGLSSYSRDGRFLETSCGTPNYASPQVVSGELYAGPDTDVWSCGVILYTMLVGALPFEDANVAALFEKIKRAEYNVPASVSPQAHDLLSRMLIVNPLERATMEQVIQHPWVRPNYPPHLLSLHYDAILHTMCYGRLLEFSEDELEETALAEVASLFEVSIEEAATAILANDTSFSELFSSVASGNDTSRKRYPAKSYYETYANFVDAKHWPSALFIPLAEKALRDVRCNMYLTYLILLQRRQQYVPHQVLPSSGAGGEAMGSLILSMAMSQGYGSLNANSLQPISMNLKSLPQFAEMSTHDDRVPPVARRACDTTFFGSLPVNVPMERPDAPVPDAYMDSYNMLAEPFISVFMPASKHTLVGKLLGVNEHPVMGPSTLASSGSLPASFNDDDGTHDPAAKSIPEAGGASAPPDCRRLLCPISSDKKAGLGETERRKKSSTRPSDGVVSVSGKLFEMLHCGTATRFGSNFVHNGVQFLGINAGETLRHVYSAMKAEGLLWKPIRPYYLAAAMHPSVKLQVRVYRIRTNEQIVDVCVSTQSGMMGLTVATKLIERLHGRAFTASTQRAHDAL